MQPQANYDFILNPQTAPPPSKFGGGQQSMAMRILVVVGGLFILMIIAVVLMGILRGGGSNKEALLSVAQDQTELLRIAEAAKQNIKLEENKDFNATLKLSVKSQQTELSNYMATSKIKIDAKSLALKQSAQTDQRLTAGASSSTYDTVYKSVMNDALKVYQADLSTAYEGAGQTGKNILRSQYDAAGLLIKQLNADH